MTVPFPSQGRCGVREISEIPDSYRAELDGLFKDYSAMLFGYAWVQTRGDRELAEDLVQETFEAAAIAWESLRCRLPNEQKAWLSKTLVNKQISAFRRQEAFRKRIPELFALYQPAETDTANDGISAVMLEQAITEISRLPDRQHTIALMRWLCDMKISEIAAALLITEGAVTAQLAICRKKLSGALGPYYQFPDGGKGKA